MALLERIAECNTYNINNFRPFELDGQAYGWVRPEFMARLLTFSDVFKTCGNGLTLQDCFVTPGQRSVAVERVMKSLYEQKVLTNWVDEIYPVVCQWGDQPVMFLERGAAAHMGIKAFGVHVNGLVKKGGQLHVWVATRSASKSNFPGKLDHIAAGGQPAGLSLELNVIKECYEEAAIPADVASSAVLVSEIEYCGESHSGLRPDTIFAFDLELSENFQPLSNDGEVESFQLLSIEEVVDLVVNTNRFKPNCNLVIIDLLYRKGLIPESFAEEHQLAHLLRQSLVQPEA